MQTEKCNEVSLPRLGASVVYADAVVVKCLYFTIPFFVSGCFDGGWVSEAAHRVVPVQKMFKSHLSSGFPPVHSYIFPQALPSLCCLPRRSSILLPAASHA